ncbi:MAG: hypothetical protein Q8N81_04235 [bacterium]|nr:hypothetical protein [bacterium]
MTDFIDAEKIAPVKFPETAVPPSSAERGFESAGKLDFERMSGDFISGYVFSGPNGSAEWGTVGVGGEYPKGVEGKQVEKFEISGSLLEELKGQIKDLTPEQARAIQKLVGWRRLAGEVSAPPTLEQMLDKKKEPVIVPQVGPIELDRNIAYAPQSTPEQVSVPPGNLAAVETSSLAKGGTVETLMMRIKRIGSGGDFAVTSAEAAAMHSSHRAGQISEAGELKKAA